LSAPAAYNVLHLLLITVCIFIFNYLGQLIESWVPLLGKINRRMENITNEELHNLYSSPNILGF
jgi:hypothetical protein